MSRKCDRRRLEGVDGRRVEAVEYGLRTTRDGVFHRKGHVEPHDSIEFAVACRERPFTGRRGDEQVVTRTVVTYTTEWTEVPGYEGSPWFHCWHEDRPDVHAAAGGHAAPHPFRERDMTCGEDGVRRYTCPVCGLVWRHRDAIPAEDPQMELF
jgi:hypothetical protein